VDEGGNVAKGVGTDLKINVDGNKGKKGAVIMIRGGYPGSCEHKWRSLKSGTSRDEVESKHAIDQSGERGGVRT